MVGESQTRKVQDLSLPLQRDVFLRSLLRELAGTLEETVGIDEAVGYISVVGQKLGDEFNGMYRAALQVSSLSREQLGEVLIDLKRRIQGDFYIISEDEEKIVFGNRACPFGDKVRGRPSLCMMTSNVFGSITAENAGYAKVVIDEAIARGDTGCRIVVYLRPSEESQQHPGREYYQT